MNKSNQDTGYLHSVETFGALDGPGIRYVLFLQGWPLRCGFCHNPDTWQACTGKAVTPEDAFEDILKYKNFIWFTISCKGYMVIFFGNLLPIPPFKWRIKPQKL